MVVAVRRRRRRRGKGDRGELASTRDASVRKLISGLRKQSSSMHGRPHHDLSSPLHQSLNTSFRPGGPPRMTPSSRPALLPCTIYPLRTTRFAINLTRRRCERWLLLGSQALAIHRLAVRAGEKQAALELFILTILVIAYIRFRRTRAPSTSTFDSSSSKQALNGASYSLSRPSSPTAAGGSSSVGGSHNNTSKRPPTGGLLSRIARIHQRAQQHQQQQQQQQQSAATASQQEHEGIGSSGWVWATDERDYRQVHRTRAPRSHAIMRALIISSLPSQRVPRRRRTVRALAWSIASVIHVLLDVANARNKGHVKALVMACRASSCTCIHAGFATLDESIVAGVVVRSLLRRARHHRTRSISTSPHSPDVPLVVDSARPPALVSAKRATTLRSRCR